MTGRVVVKARVSGNPQADISEPHPAVERTVYRMTFVAFTRSVCPAANCKSTYIHTPKERKILPAWVAPAPFWSAGYEELTTQCLVI